MKVITLIGYGDLKSNESLADSFAENIKISATSLGFKTLEYISTISSFLVDVVGLTDLESPRGM
jgi:hypothetical protein